MGLENKLRPQGRLLVHGLTKLDAKYTASPVSKLAKAGEMLSLESSRTPHLRMLVLPNRRLG